MEKDFRDEYVAEHVRSGIAYQIAALREQRGWSQARLGTVSGKPQSVISRLEDPDYGRVNVQTLLEVASAFDVAVLVKFIPFSLFIDCVEDVSSKNMYVASFNDDIQVKIKVPLRQDREDISMVSSRLFGVGNGYTGLRIVGIDHGISKINTKSESTHSELKCIHIEAGNSSSIHAQSGIRVYGLTVHPSHGVA